MNTEFYLSRLFIVGKSETYQHYTIYCGIQANTPQYIVVCSKEFPWHLLKTLLNVLNFLITL